MDHRTFGNTRNCKGCRYWSEMLARSDGGRPIEAVCLKQSGQHSGNYMPGSTTCDDWASGHFGAVDDPGLPIAYTEEA